MAIVSCPDCGKKLKVSDASVGKKVKCSCGNVFVAEEETAAPPARKPVAAAAGDKVTVACTECSSPLKVGSASLGKKMKCPKCAAVFVASAEDSAPPPPPAKKFGKPMPSLLDEDDIPTPKGKAKPKPVASDDDADGLWGFSQDDDDAPPPPKSKAKPVKKPADIGDDDDDDMPKPKRKATTSRPVAASTQAPVYPSRTLLNLFVFLMLLVNMGVAGAVFTDFLKTETLGIPHPAPKAIVKLLPKVENKKKDTIVGERLVDAKTTLGELQNREQGWVDELKKATTNPDYLTEFETAEGTLVAAAFSPSAPILATVVKAAEGGMAKIELWDLKTAKKLGSEIPPLKTTAVRPQLRFSSNGELIAVNSWEDKWVKVFKTSDGTEVASPKIEKNPTAISFSSDGKLLLVAHNAPTQKESDIAAWSTVDWKPVALAYKVDPEASHAFLADGSQMVGVKAGIATYYSKDGEFVKKCDSKIGNEHFAFSADGGQLVFAIAEVTGTSLFTQDLTKEKEAAKELRRIDFFVGTVQFSADGKLVLYTDAKDGKPYVIDVATQQVRWEKSDGLYLSNSGLLAAEIIAEPKMPNRVLIHNLAELITAKKDNGGKDPKDEKKKDKKDDAKTDKKDDTKKDDAKTDKKDDTKKDDAKTDKKDDTKKDEAKTDKKDDKASDKEIPKDADKKKTDLSRISDLPQRGIVAFAQSSVSIRWKVAQPWTRDQAI